VIVKKYKISHAGRYDIVLLGHNTRVFCETGKDVPILMLIRRRKANFFVTVKKAKEEKND
jgi:hypothetical protein